MATARHLVAKGGNRGVVRDVEFACRSAEALRGDAGAQRLKTLQASGAQINMKARASQVQRGSVSDPGGRSSDNSNFCRAHLLVATRQSRDVLDCRLANVLPDALWLDGTKWLQSEPLSQECSRWPPERVTRRERRQRGGLPPYCQPVLKSLHISFCVVVIIREEAEGFGSSAVSHTPST